MRATPTASLSHIADIFFSADRSHLHVPRHGNLATTSKPAKPIPYKSRAAGQVHRTWIDARTLGNGARGHVTLGDGYLLGHGVQFGVPQQVMIAGEGLETVLSLRTIMPSLPMVAALLLPGALRRLDVARDEDAAGEKAASIRVQRAAALGIETVRLLPNLGDFHDDLRHFGIDRLRAQLLAQLTSGDVDRFLAL